ncbi:MAG: LemA family protein [Flavobacteriaceae bacterium]|nr:LemA family protein [Flavobacteriaceae bacterium]
MKKIGCLGFGLVGLLVLGFGVFIYVKNFYNNTVIIDQDVQAQWGNVESSYQRRSDLIPNIVNTAKGYADFERATLTEVIEARSKATQVTVDPTNISPEQIAAFSQAQSGVSSALSRLLVTVERYPDLKANENFKELINELERTENRINVERNRFNEKVGVYNKQIVTFPNNMMAGFFDFDEKGFFKADAGAENAPEVEFNF